MKTTDLPDKHVKFAAWLYSLSERDDRGTLAALRRGLLLEEGHLFQLYGHIPAGFFAGLRPGEDQLFLMVAALYAFHPVAFSKESLGERSRDLGESLRILAELMYQESGSENDDSREEDMLEFPAVPDSLKRRVEALLAAPRDDLYGHLRQIVSLLKTREVPVDWARLLYDLQRWDLPDRRVQWQWSRSFYVGYPSEGGEGHDVH